MENNRTGFIIVAAVAAASLSAISKQNNGKNEKGAVLNNFMREQNSMKRRSNILEAGNYEKTFRENFFVNAEKFCAISALADENRNTRRNDGISANQRMALPMALRTNKMDTISRPIMPETPSTDGSEDSWTFLDDVENCVEVETILLADAVKTISSDFGSDDSNTVCVETKSALNVPDETDGEISDGSISVLSGNEFIRDIDDHTPMSSLPPSPPASPPQPFWMRAHRPELALSLRSCPDTEQLPKMTPPFVESEKRLNEYKGDTVLPDSKGGNQPNVFNLFLFALTGFSVVIFSVLLAQYFSSIFKISQLKEIIHNLEVENAKLSFAVDGCRNSDMAYNGSGDNAPDMQVLAQGIAAQEETFKQIYKIQGNGDSAEKSTEETAGRKVWTGDGFVIQATHIPPKKHLQYDDFCDKKNEGNEFFPESERCLHLRGERDRAELENKKAPIHKHHPRGDSSAEVIFTEDFIDPNKFNNEMDPKHNELDRQYDDLIDENGNGGDNDDDYELQEPQMVSEGNSIIPSGYSSFEDVLIKMDEHMERIAFYTQSCYTKYKKLKEDDEVSRKALKKTLKSNKKYKKDGKKDDKYEKRERKYQEKKSKNYKRN